jgi:nitroimidazol reductase NimA-like FMN-containing flavoprotein (pyridoxamine 5'-phosphate oxidase superfamily)
VSNSAQLPWAWVEERLLDTWNYWLATASEARGPHVRPIWCVWWDGALLFTSSPSSRKLRDLGADPRAAVHLELVREVVVLEGRVDETTPDQNATAAYAAKYGWLPPVAQRWYALRPSSVYAALEETYPASATRFDF